MTDFPDAEEISTQLIQQARLSTLPVNLQEIASLWPNLSVSEEALDREGYLIFLGVQGAELILRKSDPPNRKRFTFAHELGHWILSNAQDGRINFGDVISPTRSNHEARSTPEEMWCNEFASKLLIPTAEVHRYLQGPPEDLPHKLVNGHGIFHVSEDAFLFRITDITGWVIVHLVHDGQIHKIGKRYIRRGQDRAAAEHLIVQLLEQTLPEPRFPVSHPRLSGFTAYGAQKSATRGTSTYLVCLMPQTFDGTTEP